MQNAKCLKCDQESAPDAPCPDCGQAPANGSAKKSWGKPPPPPELAGRMFAPTPPEMAEEIRRTFDEAAFVADMEEALENGGADIDALIARVERKAHAAN